jgi:hypothetical protein
MAILSFASLRANSGLFAAHGTLEPADSPMIRLSMPSPSASDLQRLKTVPSRAIGRAICSAAPGNSHIATLVERHSPFTILVKVAGKDTATVVAALSGHVRKLPASLRRSLTWDRGLEMAKHNSFTVATKVMSTSAIRRVLGSVALTKTPTDY